MDGDFRSQFVRDPAALKQFPALVLNADYTVDAENGEVVRVLAGAIPAGASLKVSYEYVDPTLVTPSQVIGTVTAGGQRTGLQALDDGCAVGVTCCRRHDERLAGTEQQHQS